MGWNSETHCLAEMKVNQDVLAALFSSKWPLQGKAFATNQAAKRPGSESSAFCLFVFVFEAVLMSLVLCTGIKCL